MTLPTAPSNLPELDISPLGKPLKQLQIALDAQALNPGDEFIRDAVIQRFEFTYELSIRMLRRYLRYVAISDAEVDDLSYRQLTRRGTELGLLKCGILEWLDFRQARTDTVHTYNEVRAQQVAVAARDFGPEAYGLFSELTRRLQP